MDHDDRPDDSNKNRHAPGSVNEEVSGTGQRFKGAVKREVGDAIDDRRGVVNEPAANVTAQRDADIAVRCELRRIRTFDEGELGRALQALDADLAFVFADAKPDLGTRRKLDPGVEDLELARCRSISVRNLK